MAAGSTTCLPRHRHVGVVAFSGVSGLGISDFTDLGVIWVPLRTCNEDFTSCSVGPLCLLLLHIEVGNCEKAHPHYGWDAVGFIGFRKGIKGAFSQRSFGEVGDCCIGRLYMISHHHFQSTVVLGTLSLSAFVRARQPNKRGFAFVESWSQLVTMTWLAREGIAWKSESWRTKHGLVAGQQEPTSSSHIWFGQFPAASA